MQHKTGNTHTHTHPGFRLHGIRDAGAQLENDLERDVNMLVVLTHERSTSFSLICVNTANMLLICTSSTEGEKKHTRNLRRMCTMKSAQLNRVTTN